jgi:hypothetical protein
VDSIEVSADAPATDAGEPLFRQDLLTVGLFKTDRRHRDAGIQVRHPTVYRLMPGELSELRRRGASDQLRERGVERGFARATIRDIAARARVTHGLVMRQFESKEQLFLAAIPGHRELDRVIAGDPASVPERVAQAYVERMEAGAAGDPLVVLLRGVASDQQAATARGGP